MKRIGRTRYLFIGAGAVEDTHEHITVYDSLHSLHKHGHGEFKSRITLQTAYIDGDNRNMGHTGFFQSTADETDIVGSTAAASRLAHEDGHVIQIIFSG